MTTLSWHKVTPPLDPKSKSIFGARTNSLVIGQKHKVGLGIGYVNYMASESGQGQCLHCILNVSFNPNLRPSLLSSLL